MESHLAYGFFLGNSRCSLFLQVSQLHSRRILKMICERSETEDWGGFCSTVQCIEGDNCEVISNSTEIPCYETLIFCERPDSSSTTTTSSTGLIMDQQLMGFVEGTSPPNLILDDSHNFYPEGIIFCSVIIACLVLVCLIVN